MTTLTLWWLLVKNRVLRDGVWSYLCRVTVLALANVVLLMTIMNAGQPRWPNSSDVSALFYFVPIAAMVAAAGQWEIEVFGGMSEDWHISMGVGWAARVAAAMVESSPVAAFFVILAAASQPVDQLPSTAAWVVLMWLSYTIVGLAIGYVFGFAKEKAINNFVVSIVWLLALGPGPFGGNQTPWWFAFFPGGFVTLGLPWAELVKSGLLVAAAALAIMLASAPRSQRSYSRA